METLVFIANIGSTSKKYGLYRGNEEIAKGHFEREPERYVLTFSDEKKEVIDITQNDFKESFNFFVNFCLARDLIKDENRIKAVGVRIVAPGTFFTKHRFIDEEYLENLSEARKFAPLHISPVKKEIERIQKTLPNTKLIGISDSAFHSSLPEYAKTYAISFDDAIKWDVYRFGYHGVSISSILDKLRTVRIPKNGKLIVCHLGGGASITAIENGQSRYTTMGFTPLEGLTMSTRCGDIDPGVVMVLAQHTGLSIRSLEKYLNKASGLLGISQLSGDIRDLLKAEAEGNNQAKLALDIFVYRIKKYIGAYTAALGGLDAIIFTGTIGERSSIMRERFCEGLSYLGVTLNQEVNDRQMSKPTLINYKNARVKVAVIPTDEQQAIAECTLEVLNA